MPSAHSKATAEVKKTWIKHLSCEVCKLGAWVAENQVTHTPLEGNAIADFVDGMCSAGGEHGMWLTMLDVVPAHNDNADSGLTIQRQDSPGMCKRECYLVQKACGYFVKKNKKYFIHMLTNKATLAEIRDGMCSAICMSLKPVDLSDWKEETWQAEDPKQRQMARMRAQMKEKGMDVNDKSPEALAAMSQGDRDILEAKEKMTMQRPEARDRGEL